MEANIWSNQSHKRVHITHTQREIHILLLTSPQLSTRTTQTWPDLINAYKEIHKYMYTYQYTHVDGNSLYYLYLETFIRRFTCIYIYIYIFINTHKLHIYMHTQRQINTHIGVSVQTATSIYIHISIYIYIYILTQEHMYKCIYTSTCMFKQVSVDSLCANQGWY